MTVVGHYQTANSLKRTLAFMDQIPTKAVAPNNNYDNLVITLATDRQATRHLPTRRYSFLVLKDLVLSHSTSYFSTTFSLGIFWLIRK